MGPGCGAPAQQFMSILVAQTLAVAAAAVVATGRAAAA